jgi:hypothetical protein
MSPGNQFIYPATERSKLILTLSCSSASRRWVLIPYGAGLNKENQLNKKIFVHNHKKSTNSQVTICHLFLLNYI